MRKVRPEKKTSPADEAMLDALIDEITTDANGDDEQLWAFRQAFEDNIALPAEGSVVGEPVLVTAFDYDGNERRGLTAKRRGADGRKHAVAAADVTMASGSGRKMGHPELSDFPGGKWFAVKTPRS